MAFIIKDRVKENTTTTGTGAISLGGAAATFDTFQSYMVNGDTTYYAIVSTETNTDEWEVGLGTWNTGNTLTRTTVLTGSNGTNAVDFGSGNKDVFMTYPAAHAALAGDDVDFANITVSGTVDGRDVAADGTKLDTIETNADVTDAVNVAAAGALMKSGGTMTGALILNADPTTALGAATKEYVDTIAAAGIHYHTPVRVESPDTAGNLNATYDNGTSGVGATLTNAGTQAALVIDGVTLNTNDRVLIYSQTNAYENGIYTVTNTGSASTNWVLTRATDADSYGASDPNALGEGDAYFVKEGNTGAGELYVMNTSGVITFGTTAINFTVIAETAVYSAGTGLTLTGTTFSIGQDVGTTANVTFNQVTAAIIGNVTGNVTGNVSGNAGTATKLATARTIQLSGDVTGSASFDGSANINITAAVQDDSHAHVISNVDGLQAALDDKVPTTRTLTAGNGLTGGGDLSANRTFSVGAGSGITVGADTVSHAATSSQASVNNSGRTYIQDITLDPFGHVTGLTSATETVTNTNQLTTFQLEDGDGTEVTISHGKEVKFVEGGGIDINWTDTDNGTDGDPYDLTFTHADTSNQASVDNSNGTVIQDVTLDGYGHVTGLGSVDLDSRYVNVTGDTMTGDLTINSSGLAASPNLKINNSSASTFNHSLEAFTSNMTANQSNILVFGKSGNTKNSGYIGYNWAANASNNNYVSIGHWGSDHLFRVYADGVAKVGINTVFHDGYHPNADKWTTARSHTVTLTGDVTGTATQSVDGTNDKTWTIITAVGDNSHSHSIDTITDEHRLFNNMGDNHSTRTDFNTSYNFGWRYVQGATNGPGTGGSQFYTVYAGLGNEYPATGTSSYGMQIAYPRNTTDPYINIRYRENNSWGSWTKAAAGSADKWRTARTNTVALTNDVTGSGSASVDGTGNWTININADWQGGTANKVVNMNNFNITNVNHLTFNDPGPGEGLEWLSGSGWKIYESPDDLTTNTGGNLQFVTGSTYNFRVDTSGNTFSRSSSHAPIFYDSDNTAYYGDFASTSKMNHIRAHRIYDNGGSNGLEIGNFSSSDTDEWAKITFGGVRGVTGWDEGIIKGSSSRGVFGRTHLGYHMSDQRSFAFHSSSWDTEMEICGDGRIYQKGPVGIGGAPATSSAKLTVFGGSAAWSDGGNQGTTVGSIHLDPESSTDHYGSAITWGASDVGDGANAQAGIYVRSDGSYGTKMYLSTTDSYATGSRSAVKIDHSGHVSILRAGLDVIGKRSNFGESTNWDAVGFGNQTNMHFQGHNQFWVGAGNGTWFTGAANTKSQASGLAADASYAHDILVTTMPSDINHDRGVTFGVDSNGAGTAGWRLGKWHSGDAADSSKLVVDGGLFVKGGYTDEYDYYSNDYSAYYSSQGGAAFWGGDSGWNDPSATFSTAIQIQSGNNATNTRNPEIQFHQYGYGGVRFRYDGPNDYMYLESTTSGRFNRFIVKTDYGQIEFGPMNTSHAHLQTDRSNFYFNKELQVDTGIVRSYDEDLNLNRAGSTTARLRLTSGTTFSDQNLTVDAGTSTTLSVKCDNAGLALIRANGDDQGTGAVEVGQSNSYGGGISYNGDNSPAFASGETADNITFYRMEAGARTEVFSYPYNSNNVTFNGYTVHPNIYLADAIYHDGDTNTYMQFNAADSYRVVVGGTERVTVNSTGVRVGNTNNGYFQGVGGEYGSIQIDGGAKNGWEGYSIGGRVVFMHENSNAMGLYDDVYNHWKFYAILNGASYLGYQGIYNKLETTSTGVTVNGDLNSTSDIRYKKNIETIDNALDKVQSLRGVTFDWDHEDFDTTNRATGVIAQDVEKVLPEAVRENEDGFKNVAYGNMVGLLIEAIKEQQEQIDMLTQKLNEMENK